jgi:hypothetical protein
MAARWRQVPLAFETTTLPPASHSAQVVASTTSLPLLTPAWFGE